MLNNKIAQKIVDSTMAALEMKVNINIMDVNGIVIAAGNRDRIGTFHSAADKVIRTGKKRSVSEKEASALDNVKPGITLPIVYKNSIIGAIGMTGDPDLVEPYGELVALTAALIVEQDENQKKLIAEQRAKDGLLMDLLLSRAFENENVFIQRAQNIGIDLDVERIVMAVCVVTDDENEKNWDLQVLKNNINTAFGGINQEIPVCFFNDTLAILYPVDRGKTTREMQKKYAEEMHKVFQKQIKSDVLLCVGDITTDWREIPQAFKTAKETQRIARKFGVNRGVFFIDEYRFQYLSSKIPEKEREAYCRKILKPILDRKEEQRDLLINTLETYYRNEKKVQETASELYIHRNTLKMRLSKIAELTGYMPHVFSDACILKMAIDLLRINGDE